MTVGALGGLAAATTPAPSEHQMLEVTCATIGGIIGGVMPDVLEPATSPNHRGLCHGIVGGGALAIAAGAHWRAWCHERAAECQTRAAGASPGSASQSNEELKVLLWQSLGAVLLGFALGYASHLLLDGDTPKGIPLVVGNF